MKPIKEQPTNLDLLKADIKAIKDLNDQLTQYCNAINRDCPICCKTFECIELEGLGKFLTINKL